MLNLKKLIKIIKNHTAFTTLNKFILNYFYFNTFILLQSLH